MTTPMQTTLDRLRDRFLSHHYARHDGLEILLDDMRQDKDAVAAAGKAEAVLHKIAGAAGSLGLADLGKAASLTETFLREQIAQPDPDLAAMCEALDAFLDVSLQVCNPTAFPADDTLIAALAAPRAASATATTAA